MHSRRESEEICKRSFDAYLATKLDPGNVSWLGGDEPPDYYLLVKGVRYAVEVTTVMEMVKVGSSQLEWANIIDSLWSLVLEVEKEAYNEGTLSGTYVVGFSSPITNLAQFRASIRERLLNYVRRTQADDSAPPEVILEQQGQECFVQKSDNKSSQISPAGPVRFGWKLQIQQEACRLLQAVVTNKAYKLSQVMFPKILLLLNKYRLVDSSYYKECVPTLTSLDDFHTVFIVEDEDTGYVLYTSGADW
jgi:hypothetical protein